MFRKKCLACNSNELKEIIDLGSHPFADTFIPQSRAHEPDMIYPLVCDLCLHCGHVQTRYKTDPNDRYAQHDYSYTSSNSNFSRTHWDEFAKEVPAKAEVKEKSFIVEIGSNDGYLSANLAKSGYKTLGVDPSPYMAILAKERNVPTVTSLFDIKTADKILQEHGKADLIIANNVFNHSEEPLEFAKAASKLLAKNGKFVFEQPYWLISLESKKFDQIYHEHVSYFTVKSAKALLENVGMIIKSAEIDNYHGGSLRIIAQNKSDLTKESPKVEKLIQKEKSFGAFEVSTYKKAMDEFNRKKNDFMIQIYKIKRQGIPIIGVGAAAKANTSLNYYNLDHSLIDYVTDASPHKQGKLTPATRIPIVGDDVFAKYDEVYALILSWNISGILKEILLKINPKIKFLNLPE